VHPTPGDMNVDGVVDELDVPLFMLALTNPAAYKTQVPYMEPNEIGDISGDGVFDFGDLSLFESAAGFSPGSVLSSPTPEPSSLVIAALASMALLARRTRRASR